MDEAGDRLRAALEERVRFETLISDIASRFVTLDSDLIDHEVEEAQRRLVEALDLDRSVLFQLDEGTLVFTHYWSRPGVVPIPPNVPSTGELFPFMLGQILNGDMVIFSSLDELPAGVPDRESLQHFGAKSSVTFPLFGSGRVIGALTFTTVREERAWLPDVVNRLRLVAQVFAAALARKRSETTLRRALEENARLRDRLLEQNHYLQQEVRKHQGPPAIMGHSAAIRRVLEEIDQVAQTSTTVLLLGETGTGKELVATAIHERSPRRNRPMVRVSCAAIPTALIESELFGREAGAYTGALARQTGRFELAHESTIFLDEIGELPGEVQVKLLRVLQEKQVDRLGGSRSIKVDVRVVAATNRDLDRAVADGTFREDLYYRLNVFPIRVPPLRERVEDIPTLAWAFVEEFSHALGKHFESIAPESLEAFTRYAWPGNVRELRNVVERAAILSPGPRIAIELPRPRTGDTRHSTRLADVEREHLRAILEQTAWRIRGDGGAADLLGLKPSTLEGRMAKLGLQRPSQ